MEQVAGIAKHTVSRSSDRLVRALVVAALVAAVLMCTVLLSGCSQTETHSSEKTLVYGTTGYGVEMDDAGLNPHSDYSGWSAVRYGVGETLFKFSDSMQPEPWLATSYELIDSTHWKIFLRSDVSFTSGRHMSATAVKECLDALVSTHDRAPSDTKIAAVQANDEAGSIVVETSEPVPSLINYLCDPYAAIIDMQAGVTSEGNVAGTGPYVAQSVSDTQITLTKNNSYWNGQPNIDKVVVVSVTDGDTLTAALQSGEINACYGLPYASYSLFADESKFNVASCNGSRTFFGQVNYKSAVMQDETVRKALALGIDKQGFVHALLNGRGAVAAGAFPSNILAGEVVDTGTAYNPELAKQLLEQAGWVDSDGDGVREKNGQKLTLRWLTYPGRMELPLLAECAQATLGELGFDVQVNCSANHTSIRKDSSAWDVYASALVTAPTGDAEYFFDATCLKGSSKNFGSFYDEGLEGLAAQLNKEFDTQKRAQLASQMQQILLDSSGYFFVSHLTMGIVSQANVTGLQPHPCDYYEITVDVDIN